MFRIQFRGKRGSDEKPASAGSKLLPSLFFLFFLIIGLVVEYFALVAFAQAVQQHRWPAVPCRIVESEVREESGERPYVFTVRYEYEYKGQAYRGTVHTSQYSGHESYSEAREVAREYPVSAQTVCYVNPGHPAEAVLQRSSLWAGVVFVFAPLIIIGVGAGGLYVMWRKASAPLVESIEAIAKTEGGGGHYLLVGFFALFAVVGGAMLYPVGIRPVMRTLDAESWIETPCTILKAEVRSHSGSDSTTYSVYILYQYEFDGQTYKSDRYDLVGGSSSGYQGKADIVARYQSATDPVCYVNPQAPHEAVLERGFHAKLLLALFPLPFLLVGVGGMIHTLRNRKKSPLMPGLPGTAWRQTAARSTAPIPAVPDDRPVTLKPALSRRMRFILVVIVALFWNGIISVFLFEVIDGFRRGQPSWFSALFMSPFVLVGIVLLGAAVYQFLVMFNPRPTLVIHPGRIPLGGTAVLSLTFSGCTRRIETLRVALRGVEEAKYIKGTDTYTDHNTFHEMELYQATDPEDIASGRVECVLPEDTMHSFEAEHNKILWSVELHGRIRYWPDVKESFKIDVPPRMMPGGRRPPFSGIPPWIS